MMKKILMFSLSIAFLVICAETASAQWQGAVGRIILKRAASSGGSGAAKRILNRGKQQQCVILNTFGCGTVANAPGPVQPRGPQRVPVRPRGSGRRN